MTPTVSILMNCYNGERYVAEALNSIAAQTFQDYEVIFIDNCSTDRSVEIAKSFGDKVKVVQTPHNMSLCKARVFARPYLTGEFICVLDIDDLWLPTKLEKQIEVMRKHPDAGLIYSDTIYFTDQGAEVKAYGKDMPSGNVFEQMLANYFLSLETIMMRNSVLKQHDLFFNEKYNISSDMELFVKLAYYSNFYYINEPLAKWRYGHASESVTQFESFSKEYELLLSDLEQMIPDFKQKYQGAIKTLQGVIYNMKGIASWRKGLKSEAKSFFAKALETHKKYLVPYVLVRFMNYEQYKKMRLVLKKI